MRIISGFARGTRLASPPARQQKKQEIRPTGDRAREALFNILSRKVQGATVLDLFAGTGALGLEALSRGATAVLFVDKNQTALEILKKNVLRCLQNHTEEVTIRVMQQDLCNTLPLSHLPVKLQEGFDLILADPPYDTGLSHRCLKQVAKMNLLKPDGLFIVEERANINLGEESSLVLTDRRVYGEIAFHFYQKKDNDKNPLSK